MVACFFLRIYLDEGWIFVAVILRRVTDNGRRYKKGVEGKKVNRQREQLSESRAPATYDGGSRLKTQSLSCTSCCVDAVCCSCGFGGESIRHDYVNNFGEVGSCFPSVLQYD